MKECKYHIVFIPKYRKKKLYGNVRKRVGKIFQELCRYKGIQILEGQAMPDHVHKFFRPDMEEYLDFDDNNIQKFSLRCAAEFPTDDLETGCYKITLKFVRNGFSHQTISTKYQLCIN